MLKCLYKKGESWYSDRDCTIEHTGEIEAETFCLVTERHDHPSYRYYLDANLTSRPSGLTIDEVSVNDQDFRYQNWLRHGELHREDGPAYIQGKYLEYWIKGRHLTKEQWLANGCKEREPGKVLYSKNKKCWFYDPECTDLAWNISACQSFMVKDGDKFTEYADVECTKLVDIRDFLYSYNDKWYSDRKCTIPYIGEIKAKQYVRVIDIFGEKKNSFNYFQDPKFRIQPKNGLNVDEPKYGNLDYRYQCWRKDDKLHREDGPAWIRGNDLHYYWNGSELSKEKWIAKGGKEPTPEILYSNNRKAWFFDKECTQYAWDLAATSHYVVVTEDGSEIKYADRNCSLGLPKPLEIPVSQTPSAAAATIPIVPPPKESIMQEVLYKKHDKWYTDRKCTIPWEEEPLAKLYVKVTDDYCKPGHFDSFAYYASAKLSESDRPNGLRIDQPRNSNPSLRFQTWKVGNLYHREDGPALIEGNDFYYWWNGEKLTKKNWITKGGKEPVPAILYSNNRKAWFFDKECTQFAWDLKATSHYVSIMEDKEYLFQDRECPIPYQPAAEPPKRAATSFSKQRIAKRVLVNQLSEQIGKKVGKDIVSRNLVQYVMGYAMKDHLPEFGAEARREALKVLGNDFLNHLKQAVLEDTATIVTPIVTVPVPESIPEIQLEKVYVGHRS